MTKSAFGSSGAMQYSAARKKNITKTFLIVKLTLLLVTVTLFSAHAHTNAQQITIAGKNLSFEKIFTIVEEQTGFVFFGDKSLLIDKQIRSISLKNVPLRQLLNVIFKDFPLEYDIQGKTIFLTRTLNNSSPAISENSTRMSELHTFVSISGSITDTDGKALVGATVSVLGKRISKLTDQSGNYIIEAEMGDVLVASYIGYEKQERKVTGNLLNFKLALMPSVLDETQVTAYGKTTKRLATGNIVSVTAADIEKQPVMSVLEALIGRVPGMTVAPTSGNSAAPINVLIRGKNTINTTAITDPLYVIDGVPLTYLPAFLGAELSPVNAGAAQGGISNTNGENPLFNLNPYDVERIDVLKDADATAIYGSRGANGVILITTKRAKVGPSTVNLKLDYGPTFNQHYPKLLKTEEFLAIRREAFRNDGLVPDQYNAPDLTIWDPNKYTDWQRELIGVGNRSGANIGISGGSGQTAYRLGAGYQTSKEIMNNGGTNIRTNLNTSVNHSSVNNKFKLSFNNSLSLTDVTAYAIGDLANIAPNAPDIYTENGDFNFVPYRGQQMSNFPFSGLKTSSASKTVSNSANINASYQMVNGLTLSALVGYNMVSNNLQRLAPSTATDAFYRLVNTGNYVQTTNKSINIEPQLMYQTKISKGSLSFQLIGTFQSATTQSTNIEGRTFSNDALMKSHNNAATKTITEANKQYVYASGAGILRYAWDNKYILNLNAKRDGSSRFAPGKQFGNFASVGLAWIVSEEEWVKDVLPSWVSFVKLRGSAGSTGSDNIGDYKYLSQWSGNIMQYLTNRLYKYSGLDAYHVLEPLNQEFHWESVVKSELALNLSFLNNRITLDVSAYRNVANNQLITLPVAMHTGFSNFVTNWDAKIANRGIEISIIANAIQTKDLSLQLNFAVSKNRDKLLEFPDLDKSNFKGRLKVGESTTLQYLLHYTGIDPLTGNYTFEDHNKDGIVTSPATVTPFRTDANDDRYIPVQTADKYNGNLGINFSYRKLLVSTNINFLNRLRQDPYITASVGGKNNIHLPDDIRDNHWQYPGHIAKYPKYTTVDPTNLSNIMKSDAKFIDGSYIRMQTLSIGYNLPKQWLNKAKIKSGSISLQTNNIFTLTKYPGLNPDILSTLSSTPIPRTISTSLQLTF